jgi:hypothetical protein
MKIIVGISIDGTNYLTIHGFQTGARSEAIVFHDDSIDEVVEQLVARESKRPNRNPENGIYQIEAVDAEPKVWLAMEYLNYVRERDEEEASIEERMDEMMRFERPGTVLVIIDSEGDPAVSSIQRFDCDDSVIAYLRETTELNTHDLLFVLTRYGHVQHGTMHYVLIEESQIKEKR